VTRHTDMTHIDGSINMYQSVLSSA